MIRKRIPLLLAVVVALIAPAGYAAPARPVADPIDALASNAKGRLTVHVAPDTGVPDFIRAYPGALLARDGGKGSPEARARRFLSSYGAAIGMSAAERKAVAPGAKATGAASELRLLRVDVDVAGKRHVRFEQHNRGKAVFGAQVLVHLDHRGVTAVDGAFIPGITGSARATVAAADAQARALNWIAKSADRANLRVLSTDVQWHRMGLLQGTPGRTVLAYAVVVDGGPEGAEQVWVDATHGHVIVSIPVAQTAKDRIAYTPQYDKNNPDRFAVRREGDPPTNIPPVDGLYEFTGQVYDYFQRGFGRDSYDDKGITMRTVYLINNRCPNAYWNGSTTNYCPGFDLDDVVAHEWGHAYTQMTHGLIYMCQSGALNESYSDIWGELIDLTNGMDGIGGTNNDQPHPAGQRWLVGEDLTEAGLEAIGLRDMWDPARLGDPAKSTDSSYVCANESDNGGVHTNSGIPNHAFVMLVDGKTFNGQTVRGLGMTKAAHLYYQASVAYQYPAVKFAGHEQALLASCADLMGVDLRSPLTGRPSGEKLTADDCAQIPKAMKAVEMSKPPTNCTFTAILADKSVPALCPGATVVFEDDFEGGLSQWTLDSEGANPEWGGYKWERSKAAPDGRAGSVALARDVDDGSCEIGSDVAGRYGMTSKTITAPAGDGSLRLRFDHYVATERFDGGNVLVSVNGGDFTVLPREAYLFNPPNAALPAPPAGDTSSPNPKAGELAWGGTDGGEAKGSWGTTLADLGQVAEPGDTIAIRFDFGLDCGGGIDGWYVDNVAVFNCPVLPAPSNVTTSATDGVSSPFTVSWTRPAGASGPDTLEESSFSCAPLLSDDAESGLSGWTATTDGIGAQAWQTSTDKPEHDSTTFYAPGLPGVRNANSDLTSAQPVKLPARGTAMLTFRDWFYNEGDDAVRVDVSADGGKTWKPVYTKARADSAAVQALSYAEETLTPRSADLTPFMGRSILVRFRLALGPDDRASSIPWGWHVDDIAVQTDSWTTVAIVNATSYRIAQHAPGRVCYRARTTYRVNGAAAPSLVSSPSGTVAITKAFGSSVRGIKKAPPATGPLPATGVGSSTAAGLALLGIAVALAGFRRRGPA